LLLTVAGSDELGVFWNTLRRWQHCRCQFTRGI